jgi:hypothetical protein
MARRRVRFAMVAVLGLSTALLQPGGAAAQQGSASSTIQTTIEVVADGLNAPRGLVYDQHRRRVLVAEAGVAAGNTGPCGFAERGLFMCLGHTGSVFQYSELGAPQRRIVTGLPSTALQSGPTVVIGLHDLSLHDGRLSGSFGLLGSKPYRESLGEGAALLGQVARLDDGTFRPYGDIATFIDERYPNHLESDPYGLLTGPYGTVVANAGGHTSQGNNLLWVGPFGTIIELAQFPDRPAIADPTDMITSVPTSVARGPDGAFYVGELTGAPFYAGEARVWRVVPGRPPTVFADGFSTIIDIAFDERGRLIVLQTGANPFNNTLDGALIRVERDGQRTVLASAGVKNPGGVAIAGPGVFYVTTMLASGGGVGQLLKIRVSG